MHDTCFRPLGLNTLLFVGPDPGQEFPSFIAFNATAKGPLWEKDDDGNLVLVGPGQATVVQRGLFLASWQGAVADGFPVERSKLQPVGQ